MKSHSVLSHDNDDCVVYLASLIVFVIVHMETLISIMVYLANLILLMVFSCTLIFMMV